MGRTSKYSPEFREEAVRLVLETQKPIVQVAKDLGISSETLRNWVRRHKRDHHNEPPALDTSDRARLRELERRNAELERENSFLKKPQRTLREGSPVAAKYEFMETQKTGEAKYAYSVTFMCDTLNVSRSGFYEWRNRPESATAERREYLKLLIQKAFDDSDETFGYRRIHAQLQRWDVQAGPELVRLLMRQLGLEPCQPRPARVCLTEAGGVGDIPDLVQRDFTAPKPGVKLVGDITYISTWEGWLYLATVIDCCTKEVIGYAMDDHYRTPLIIQALKNAQRNGKVAQGAIFYSDRGSNYTSFEFGQFLAGHGFRRSVGRTGICYNNALAESFFGALKNERVNRVVYPTRERARRDIIRHIEHWYNHRRLHSALGYNTPAEVYAAHQEMRLAA
ncbi:IS3 family transposase [Nocardiopsis flavescens]|uniref:IS3 family transposase n=1 Tax=Nocardiopsis flavescens TaxID=758803 RepID=UPI00365B7DF1